MKKILSNKLYLKLLISDLISNFGDTLYFIALMTYVTEIKNSNLAISIVTVSESLPILFTVFFGMIADKTLNKVEMIIKTLWIRVILYLLVAIAMNFRASIIVVIVASVINLISDTLGQFENGLFYPISNRIVKKSDREETMAFKQTITSTMNIINQSLGAFLITIFSFFHLAIINSMTFAASLIIMLCLKNQINKYYQEKTSSDKVSPIDFRAAFSDISSNLRLAIKHLFRINNMRTTLLVIPILNGSLAILIPLVVVNLSKGTALTIINSATTISLLGISTVSGGILGGALILISNKFKQLSIASLLQMNLLTILLSFIAFYYQNIYLIIFGSFLSSIFVSALNPKMGAIIFNNIDEKKLATTFGGMVTYFQLGEVVSRLMFSALVIYLSYNSIAVIYMIIILTAFIYTFSKVQNH
ncbi:MFS transporter [Facklamia sp. 7083-14-GEN3]|uniref:MFS transporter n=1 Tax=Facklamia sp. 7083-14-GEN3 TaxID=2973478 RepID=UPI00215D53FF|nr:MFS transporter [Facklamia sp. 7083-14-GEN3]MCR8969598.1 MFS transporter [Facklamia sp. 7083-14-GEN3]